ncbi:hypothetical protein CCR75_001576 [Bremia lactucae]|uniref:ABC1 atypical kinase-like domain-containing protein n=1 Tax=Bremia lactucae TaxID=4779 RepID=A0A976FHJ0_BRELC|nr:hypothetical protein CCR75_001576 [Bremia lactucae]
MIRFVWYTFNCPYLVCIIIFFPSSMWTKDFVRVFQGAGKVAEQALRLQRSEVANQSENLTKHAVELSRLVPFFISKQEGSTVADAQKTEEALLIAAGTPVKTYMEKPIEEFKTQDTKMPHELKTQDTKASVLQEPILQPQKEFKTHDTKASVLQEPINPPRKEFKTTECQIKTEPLPIDSKMVENTSSTRPEITIPPVNEPPKRKWEEKHVPSSPLSRILGFGSLAARLAVGTATEIVRSGGKNGTYNAFVSDANVEKLVETLCTMRGAALKLGQMLSIQDEAMIPSKLALALDRVRENAHVMPRDQLYQQLEMELGQEWPDRFQDFDDIPIAAASIGQVHRGTLLNGDRVAIKIQYPGVAESINSDLLNLKRLVTYTNILPRGLYIDEIIRVGKEELTAECDYIGEAQNQERFQKLLENQGMTQQYVVPRVYRELSTSRVLTTQLISGVAIDKTVHLSQNIRDSIARRILELTIQELFAWRFMQTDPNWSNFMYNASTDTIGLVDFGAAREYPQSFVDDYFHIVWAAANHDEKSLIDYSIKMHFLTGDESKGMMRAHVAAGMVVGEPFRSHEPFDFEKSKLTTRLGQHTEMFMQGRLTPPPQEAYSLHRKLAGAFLMCIKLRAIVPCRDVLEDVRRQYYS